MKTIVGFLEVGPGEKSWQRLQSLLLTILFIMAAGYHVYKNGLSFEMAIILAAVAVLPKTFQKIVEMKFGEKNGDSSTSEKTTKSTVETQIKTESS